jgi:hypothetical protein
MHGPVSATRLTELPGTVQRVDDPDPSRPQALRTVLGLLRQHRIIRAMPGELAGDPHLGTVVALTAKNVGVAAVPAQPLPKLEEELARPMGNGPRQLMIGHGGGGHRRSPRVGVGTRG